MPIRRPRREEIAAAILAPVVVLGAVFAGLQRDTSSHASSEPTPVDLDAPIPVDARLRTGKLRNELQYFVQRNHWPEKRAELRLVVNAGSVLEADDQRGLAHAVEHMLFRGTKRFPGHFVDNYLMSIGMRRGSDINASTSEDETIYRITVPTDRLGAIDTALAILADMARNAVFDANEAQQEGGVVLSEWRSRSSARQRLYDDRNALLLSGSPYAGHPVIGDTAVLRRFDLAAMKRFYADWYRPDLMAVVAVGDFEAPAVEELVKKHFGDVPKARSPRARSDAIVPRPPEPRAA
ncbi:MAG TPA: pitrilysin family protein, partial [Gemmatimonadaceae bacterium]